MIKQIYIFIFMRYKVLYNLNKQRKIEKKILKSREKKIIITSITFPNDPRPITYKLIIYYVSLFIVFHPPKKKKKKKTKTSNVSLFRTNLRIVEEKKMVKIFFIRENERK